MGYVWVVSLAVAVPAFGSKTLSLYTTLHVNTPSFYYKSILRSSLFSLSSVRALAGGCRCTASPTRGRRGLLRGFGPGLGLRQDFVSFLACTMYSVHVCNARGGRSGVEPDSHLGHGVACTAGCRPP